MKRHVSSYLLLYFVLPLKTLCLDTTESGEEIKIKVSNSRKQITVDGFRVVEKDMLAANGISNKYNREMGRY